MSRRLARVVQLLERQRTGEAVRALLEAHLDDDAFAQWLDDLSESVRELLTSAFAHFPCFACAGGVEPCTTCGSSGFTAVAQVCVACIGLGQKRCDFCNGSGLATYGLVPVHVRLRTIVARLSGARKHLKRMAARHPDPLEDLNRRVLTINKLLGVFENGVVAVRDLVNVGAIASEAGDRLTEVCCHVGAEGNMLMRDALNRLSGQWHRSAPRLCGPDADNAGAKAAFFRELGASESFAGTGISHPFLTTLTSGSAEH